MKLTCIYGFEWNAEIVAENDNTYVFECKDTGHRGLVHKGELDPTFKPYKHNKNYRFEFDRKEVKEIYETKEDLFRYIDSSSSTLKGV